MGWKIELGKAVAIGVLTRYETPREAYGRALTDPNIRQEFDQSIAGGHLEIDNIPTRSSFEARRVLRFPGGRTFSSIHRVSQPFLDQVKSSSPQDKG
jgi:hypothetical protein